MLKHYIDPEAWVRPEHLLPEDETDAGEILCRGQTVRVCNGMQKNMEGFGENPIFRND